MCRSHCNLGWRINCSDGLDSLSSFPSPGLRYLALLHLPPLQWLHSPEAHQATKLSRRTPGSLSHSYVTVPGLHVNSPTGLIPRSPPTLCPDLWFCLSGLTSWSAPGCGELPLESSQRLWGFLLCFCVHKKKNILLSSAAIKSNIPVLYNHCAAAH